MYSCHSRRGAEAYRSEVTERSKILGLAAVIALVLALDGWVLATAEPSEPAGAALEEVGRAQSADAFLAGAVASVESPTVDTDSEPRPVATDQPEGAPSRPSVAALPRAGTYTWRGHGESASTYSSTTKQEGHDDEDIARYEVLPASAGDARVRRHNDYKESEEGGFTSGGSSFSEYAWRPEGVLSIGYRVQSKGTDSGGHTEQWANGCDWTPPMPEVLYPLAEGTTWSWVSTCTDEHDETVVLRQEWKGTARIEGWDAIQIGGEEVAAIRIRYSDERISQGEFRNQPPGGPQMDGFRIRSQGVRWFAPGAGLLVRSDTRTVTSRPEGNTSDDFEQRSHHTTELVSLIPT